MTAAELRGIFESPRAANFDNLKSNHFAQHQPSILFICNKYQLVSIKENETMLTPVITKLDAILNKLQKKFEIVIQYEQKKPVTILDWPKNLPPLADIMPLRIKALASYQKTKKVDVANPLYTKIEKFEPTMTNNLINAYISGPLYRSEENIYMVGIYNCASGSPECITGTLYPLQVYKIENSKNKVNDLNIWPENIGIY